MCGFACDSAGTPATDARHRRPPPTPATDARHRRPREATTRAGTRGRCPGSFPNSPQNTHGKPRSFLRQNVAVRCFGALPASLVAIHLTTTTETSDAPVAWWANNPAYAVGEQPSLRRDEQPSLRHDEQPSLRLNAQPSYALAHNPPGPEAGAPPSPQRLAHNPPRPQGLAHNPATPWRTIAPGPGAPPPPPPGPRGWRTPPPRAWRTTPQRLAHNPPAAGAQPS